MIAGYWAANKTIFRNTVFIEFSFGDAFMKKLVMGTILGWILIPVAIIMTALGK